ncbi:amino acid adenylation domain-containing protein/thioester reductase-like protein [Paenibacillus phyllosphaerae]|uniref:Amino acid adenylation domain-containing protein/thioester reductase-like protein n=1 Tax=Paenibacillus phyllosphaerae TaxID=274593 RepID=A0A7W5AXV7_9BACL|nr:non-ribosomal peptide synthetase [Paenibacillus phyllosphaerae]MBB3110778.1 amino acid adenylation domain-containing protein/thioester reductase-like protein [Paenibacillus phyllosphaerae]
MMSLPQSRIYHSAVKDAPVLNIPCDYSLQRRSDLPAATLVIAPDSDLARLAQQRYQGQRLLQIAAASIYAALLYRLSGGEADWRIGLVQGGTMTAMHWNWEKEALSFASLLQDASAIPIDTARELPGSFETLFVVGQSAAPAAGQLLNAHLTIEKGGWSLQFIYDASLIKPETIERYASGYRKLLAAMLADESARIGAVDILTEEEHALYRRMNDTAAPYAAAPVIHHVFEQIAAAYPDRTSIFDETATYTYRTLNEQANRIARLLLDRGLRKGDFVTIFMERSLGTVVSLLGVLKAGGVYVPVDPEHPEERIRYIMEDTSSPFMLTNRRYEARAATLASSIGSVRAVMPIDDGSLDIYSGGNVQADVKPGDLAYVIYTSGSTGKPKGVLIAHEGVVNLGAYIKREFAVTEHDVMTQFATYSFDASVWETFGALLSGASLYLLNAEERISVEAFADAVERTRTSVVIVLPTVFFNEVAAHLSDDGYRKLASITKIMTAGEALYGEQVRILQRRLGEQVAIYNLYGPTECTVCATVYQVEQGVADHVTHVPIGTPISNYKVYIVGPEQSLCPVGVPGELYISTVAIAQGYLNQADRTAAAFVDNPFEPGTKAYRSGDIVKLRADGTIEYVGRRDSQVKIRGHRIEIGAIEDTLAKHPLMHIPAVIARKDDNGQTYLVCFYTTKDGQAAAASELASFIHAALPPYYVPKRFCHLEAMPLSTNGKVERKLLAGYAIPEDEQEASESDEPLTPVQEQIAAAWKEVLGLKQISAAANFFDSGGDSLDIIHVLVQLKPRFPHLTIGDLFTYETVEALAAYAEQSAAAENSDRVVTGGVTAFEPLAEFPVKQNSSPRARKAPAEPEHILLTGATGYLGSHLLYQILTHSRAMVYALVRGAVHKAACDRLEEVMSLYFGPSIVELMKYRVQVIEADLEQPMLGLSHQEFTRLPAVIDTIVHAAADVRHFGDAKTFERTNVISTNELLALAQAGHGIHFHHVSTVSVPESLAHTGQWNAVVRDNQLADTLQVENVYSSSKLEAEKLVLKANAQGLATTIYRPGNLTCHSESGRFQRNIESNAFYQLIKAMLLLGKAPKADWYVDFTPINYASEAMANLMLRPDTEGELFHIVNPQQILYTDLVEMVRLLGYEVELMDKEAYTAWLLDPTMDKDQEGTRIAMSQLGGDGAQDSPYVYNCDNTTAFLRGTGISCAPADELFIRRMIDHAVAIGYFPPVLEKQV